MDDNLYLYGIDDCDDELVAEDLLMDFETPEYDWLDAVPADEAPWLEYTAA